LPACAKLHDATYDWIHTACEMWPDIAPQFHVDAPPPPVYATIHTQGQDRRVKLTMASRLGDVGFLFLPTSNTSGYDQRTPIDTLHSFSLTP
jgi:hypothetical protein